MAWPATTEIVQTFGAQEDVHQIFCMRLFVQTFSSLQYGWVRSLTDSNEKQAVSRLAALFVSRLVDFQPLKHSLASSRGSQRVR